MARPTSHHVNLAKVQTQQENRLLPFLSALETFFSPGYLSGI
jgi:hypothetical protein